MKISLLVWHQLLWNSICNLNTRGYSLVFQFVIYGKYSIWKEWKFVIWLLKQPKCKIEQMSLSLLKKRIVAVLLFCLLSVLSERIVVNFQGHVTCCFSLMEGLLYTQSLKYCASTMHFSSAYYFVTIFSLLVIQQRLFEFIAY